jgi:tetratricopeptide (TPR) repeat protein
VFDEAHAYTQRGDYEKARAMYLWLLARDPNNRDAQLALSHIDAWDDCFSQAEQRYHALLRSKPDDVEALAGLIDVLFWSDHWDEAGGVIDRGLHVAPDAPALWQRRARWLQWSGDRTGAVEAARHAETLAPDDPDIRLLRDRLFTGQARASVRADLYPNPYPSLYTADISALQYWKRLELGVDAQVISRIGGAEAQPIVDGLYTATGIYHAKAGTAAGLSLGFGAPARAIPAFTARGFLLLQIASRWSGYFAYSFWQYHDHKSAHIFAPAISYALTDTFQVELRWWTSFLVLERPMASANTALVHAVGARAMWRILTPWTLGLSYTYGPQLDTSPARYEFLRLTSHVFGLFGDWLVQRDWGISPMIGFERRSSTNGSPVALIYSAELATYIRW